MKKRLQIAGMSCMHCVMHVKNALTEVPGVRSVDVSLSENSALVEAEGASDEAMKAAVEDAGYDVVKIEVL